VTDEPIQLLDGRYGPYVTDGTTNASIPRTATAEEVDFKMAVDLLAERAASGPAKKTKKKKAVAKKSKPKKKTTTKRKTATTKKATTKKASTKKKGTTKRKK